MKIISSYRAKILNENIFNDTVKKFREALSCLMEIFNKEWPGICAINNAEERQNYAMSLIHSTKTNKAKYEEFDKLFPTFPTYLRRAAVAQAIGKVSSYRSNYRNWEDGGKKGKAPTFQVDHNCMPVFYRDNMYNETDNPDVVELKLFIKNDWRFVKVRLRHTDVRYLQKYWTGIKSSAPVLEKRYGEYYLRFAFEENVKLKNTDIQNQKICSVDLGINTDAVCSIMNSTGTILDRKFIDFPGDKDHIIHVVNRIKKYQREHGSHSVAGFWSYAQRINAEHGNKVAAAIVEYAILRNVDCIVFEHLDMKGKKRGKNKQRLALWRKNTIQSVTTHAAHRHGIHISRVCAWGTSALAYDGSGKVVRDDDNHALCTFKTGKRYNCDLSASYNIGARYFIRELLQTLSARKRSLIGAKVPGVERRISNTLSTLIAFNKELLALSEATTEEQSFVGSNVPRRMRGSLELAWLRQWVCVSPCY